MQKEVTRDLLREAQVRKIFNIFFLCICFFLADVSTGGWVHSARLPADIYFNAGVELKNRDVVRAQQYLFTRVDLNRNADGTGRLVVHFYDDDDLQNIHLFLTGHSDR